MTQIGTIRQNCTTLKWTSVEHLRTSSYSASSTSEGGGRPGVRGVEIDGVAYDMTPEGKGADYADGVLFEYKADGLACGPQTPFLLRRKYGSGYSA